MISINGRPVRDQLDCRYHLAEEKVVLEFQSPSGKNESFELENDFTTDLGLRFAQDKIKACRNKCIFCFVHQQPKGMRRPLYFRDDDYRLSFTHGNFITLSNLKEEDIERIVSQRLSPLYVSVHTTDDDLRRKMFGNRRLPPIIPSLKELTSRGIKIHTQIVACPGINDGKVLSQTVSDLFELYPGIASVGVVPVGLTRYRDNLPELKPFSPAEADEVLSILHSLQRKCRAQSQTRFVCAADEFYILSGRKLPSLHEYEDMPQFENGIGMMRLLLSDFKRRRRYLEKYRGKERIAILTGKIAYPILQEEVVAWLKKERSFKIEAFPVTNDFWGEKITVSGLLTGTDLMKSANNLTEKYDIILLPPNCLNDDNLFLDDMNLTEFRKKINARVLVGRYSMIDTLREMEQ